MITKAARPVAAEPPLTVWYDGGCPLCTREIEWFRRRTRGQAVDYVDLRQTDSCPLDVEALLARFHAQEAGGPLVSGAAAFAALWRRAPGLRPLGRIARWPPALAVLELAYIAFLRLRRPLQRFAVKVLGWRT